MTVLNSGSTQVLAKVTKQMAHARAGTKAATKSLSAWIEVLNDTQGNGESEGQQWDFGWDGNTVWKVNVPQVPR